MHCIAFIFLINFYFRISTFSHLSSQLKRETNSNYKKMSSSDLKDFLLTNSAIDNSKLLFSLEVDEVTISVK